MLRRKPGAPAARDSIDGELLEAVDEGMHWRGLLVSASCPPEEAEARLLRLIHLGYLEGEPYDNTRRPPPPETAPPEFAPSSTASESPPRQSSVPPEHSTRAASAAIPPPANGRTTAPPAALAAGESLLRELARRSGVSFAPVAGPGDAPRRPSSPSFAPGEPGSSGMSLRPSAPSEPGRSGMSMAPGPASGIAPRAGAPHGMSSAPPQRSSSASLAPVGASRATSSSAEFAPIDLPTLPGTASSASFAPVGADPYGSSSLPPAPRPPSDGQYAGVDSPLLGLIRELGGGPGMQRWTAARLREALNEELSGNFPQAVSILQVVMAQVEDQRIRAERDRLHSKALQASSGVFRKQAIDAERGLRHNEAAAAWRKVLEATPNDGDAALHAAMCYMEAGNLKQAGALARRAVELAPDSVNAHRILYRFFRKTGMEASAKREHDILSKLRKA